MRPLVRPPRVGEGEARRHRRIQGRLRGRAQRGSRRRQLLQEFPSSKKYDELLEATDKLDAAQLTKEDVEKPKAGSCSATRSIRAPASAPSSEVLPLARRIREGSPIAKILKHPEVKKRADRVLKETAEYKKVIKKNSKLNGTVILTDLRRSRTRPPETASWSTTLYPKANVEVRVFRGKEGKTSTSRSATRSSTAPAR